MATVATEDVRVSGQSLLALVDEWLGRGGRLYERLSDSQARLVYGLRTGERQTVAIDTADRLLIAIGLEYRLAEIAPPPLLEGGGC